MQRYLFVIVLAIVFLVLSCPANAIEDPLAKPNNRIGIHLLFPTELQEASALVNANGGEWGYVVIPIKKSDRDLKKWQEFMDKCREYKLIPIVRLATDGDYFNTKVWRKPKEEDVLDFANFLNSLNWPVKNRYVIIFNEVNRDDEWGGKANASEYASLLSYSILVFKSLDQDFFVISSGMDNASINGNGAINQFTYFRQMDSAVPGIFNQIDGISSHAYPNPGFASHPLASHQMSILSFAYERDLAESMTNGKKLPVFITETGWSGEVISQDTLSEYYRIAFSKVWNDPGVVAVTPFLLRADFGPFQKFSFLKSDGFTKQYEGIKNMQKVKGEPTLNQQVLGTEIATDSSVVETKRFVKKAESSHFSKKDVILETLKFFFGL